MVDSVSDPKGFVAVEVRTEFGGHLVQQGGHSETLKEKRAEWD